MKKFFKSGDYVRVIRGKYKGERGLIVRVEDAIITLFSDLTMTEIKCFARDLKKGVESTASTGAFKKSGNYDILDFIQIDPHSVGVIVKIENDMYQVIDQNGMVRTLESLNELTQKKRDSRRAVALDFNSNQIKVGDNVRIVDGEYKNRLGNVLHIFRSFIFVKSNEIITNCGVYVFRNSNIELVGANKNTAIQQPNPGMAAGYSAPSFRPSGGMGAGRGRRDPLLGKSVHITNGPYKGYLGIVKDSNDQTARVELHTKSKTITVDKSKLMLQDGTFVSSSLATSSSSSSMGGWQSSYGRSGMLASGLQTPMVAGFQTPMVDGNGGKTPAWDAGSKTPAWDAGSKTPAWDAGSKTPAWDAGSKTPAWDVGARTPAWNETVSIVSLYII